MMFKSKGSWEGGGSAGAAEVAWYLFMLTFAINIY